MRDRKSNQKSPDGNFAENLAWWRARKKLSNKEVSQKLGVASSTWSQWETGKRRPSVSYVSLLAKVLDVPACALFSENLIACSECLLTNCACVSHVRIHGA